LHRLELSIKTLRQKDLIRDPGNNKLARKLKIPLKFQIRNPPAEGSEKADQPCRHRRPAPHRRGEKTASRKQYSMI
jgi:hypothetical protein